MSNRDTVRLIDPVEFVACTPTELEPIQIRYMQLAQQIGYAGLHTFPAYLYTKTIVEADEHTKLTDMQALSERGGRYQSGANRFALSIVEYFNRLQQSGRLSPEMEHLRSRLSEYTMNDMRNADMNHDAEEYFEAEIRDTLRELPFAAAQSKYVRQMLRANGITDEYAKLESLGIISSAVALRGLIRLDVLEALAPGQTTLKQSIIRVRIE